MQGAHLALILYFERSHRAVACRRGLSVEGGFDVKVWQGGALTCGDGEGVAEALRSFFKPLIQRRQEGRVEPLCEGDVLSADCDVCYHWVWAFNGRIIMSTIFIMD